MKKSCQRGFVLGILVFMFLQIKTIINGYDKSFSYNTIPGIYHAREIGKFVKNNEYATLIEQVDENGFVVLNNTNATYTSIFNTANVKNLVISSGDLSLLKADNSLSPKFQNYIKTLTNSKEYKLIFEFNDDTFTTIKG